MEYWQKAVYLNKDWEPTRQYVFKRDEGKCQLCGKLILGTFEVDHIEELSKLNYLDWNIAFNPDNLRSVHPKCHNIRHKRFCEVKKESVVNDDLEIDYERRK